MSQRQSVELSDWKMAPFGDESNTAQRRRIVSTTRVDGAGAPESSVVAAGKPSNSGDGKNNLSVQRSVQYSVSATRTAYSDTINDSAARPRDVIPKRNRAEGGTWATSSALYSALHQSGTGMRDSQPMMRNIENKVVIDKIQQPKPVDVDNTAVRIEATRVRGVGFR